VWLAAGTLPLARAPDHVRNTSLLFSPQGQCVARYDKIHLFRFDNGQRAVRRIRVVEPGDRPVTATLTDRSGQTWPWA
jgi:nitrilase